RAIWAAGPRSIGAGSASVTGAPVRAAATAPSGSNETTITGVAPPDHATSAMRRTAGRPSASARAESGGAARITAATVMSGWYDRPDRVRAVQSAADAEHDDRPQRTCPDADPGRPPQHRDRRPCRPWQDHPGRRDAPPDRHVPLER